MIFFVSDFYIRKYQEIDDRYFVLLTLTFYCTCYRRIFSVINKLFLILSNSFKIKESPLKVRLELTLGCNLKMLRITIKSIGANPSAFYQLIFCLLESLRNDLPGSDLSFRWILSPMCAMFVETALIVVKCMQIAC